jgi:hypothetical protein
LAILPIDDADADPLLTGLSDDERNESWRLALADGRLVGYGRGLVELARATRLTRPLSRLLERVSAERLDRLYGALSDRRDKLAHVVPDGPAPRRFP